MKKHRLTLLSGHGEELRVSAWVLQEAISALIESARGATRLAIDGVSVRKGPKPDWLEAACRIDVTALRQGSAQLELEAPTLEEAGAWRLLGGQTLFDDPQRGTEDKTVIDLLGDILEPVTRGRLEDIIADRPLLDSCVRLVRSDPQGIKLEGVRGGSLELKAEHVKQLEHLRDKTPAPEAVRIVGLLDTISESRPDIILKVEGVRVPARIKEHDAELLQRLFRRSVVVSGTARFRASGKILSIEVDTIQSALDSDRIFAVLPIPRSQASLFLNTKSSKNNLSEGLGKWPGDETEEDLLLALKDIG